MSEAVPILFVHHRSELGGAPASLSYLIQQLDRSRFTPHVYCPAGPAAQLFEDAGAIVHRGPVAAFTHIWASTYKGRRWLLLGRELLKLPAHVIGYRRVLRRHRFGLVHVNDSPLVVAAWLADRKGVPVIWHLRSALPNGSDLRSRLVRRAVDRFGSASIAITQDVADVFDVGSEVIPNPVDLEKFRPGDVREARESLGLPLGEPIVTFFGFIYPSKGFRDFIEAAALLRARGVEARYLIVGGPVRGTAFFKTATGRIVRLLDLARDYDLESREMVSELGLDGVVQFLSFTSETPQLYRASDVVVSPSRGPELGRPVIEASACGRALVASGSLSGAGIVRPAETGLLVPQRSPDVLAVALERLLRDDELRTRLGANARRYAEQRFDSSRNAERVMAVYDRVLAA